MTRIAVGGPSDADVEAVASAYREVLTASRRRLSPTPSPPSGRTSGPATRSSSRPAARRPSPAASWLAIGLGDLDVVGSQATVPVRRAMGESKVTMLRERGYPPPWAAVYSDSTSDLPLFAGTPRPVLVNADEKAARQVERTLGRRPETVTWR